jgi:hypothetical protein
MIRNLIFVAAIVLLSTTATRPLSADARMQEIMRNKLSNTQVLLKGIVTADYKSIDRAATALNRISEAEITSWQNPPNRQYVEQAMLFISSVDDLRQAAESRHMSDVSDAYSALISSCLHCHIYVRDARNASLTTGISDTVAISHINLMP